MFNIYEIIDKAIERGLKIKISYTKNDSTSSERTLSEIEYYKEYGHEYIYAFCNMRCEYRTFKISRINQVQIVDSMPETKIKMDNNTPYIFNPNKKIFKLYGE